MAKEKNKTWIKLYRSLMDHEIWTGEPFTKGQAWVDLLMLANHDERDAIYNGKVVHVGRGQVLISIRFLAKRWHRSKDWVGRTLKTLVLLKMCDIERDKTRTLLTIENYASFQGRTDRLQDTDKDKDKDTGKDKNKNNKRMYIQEEPPYPGSDLDGSLPGAGSMEEVIERFIWVTATDGRKYKFDTVKEEYVD